MTSRRSARLSTKASNEIQGHSAPAQNGHLAEIKNKVTKKSNNKAVKAAAVTDKATANSSRKRKAAIAKEEVPTTSVASATPTKKRSAPATAAAPALDTDPILVTPKAKKARPANPKVTNAPLQTPGGTRVLKAYPTELLEQNGAGSPSKVGTTTTANILDEAVAHILSVDPRLKSLVDKHTCTVLTPAALSEQVNPFVALCSSIMGQQVSGAAAAAIKRKFIGLFEPDPAVVASITPVAVASMSIADSIADAEAEASVRPVTATSTAPFFPSPAQVAATPIERLRTAGLSLRKAEYIQGLAEKFSTGQLSAKLLIEATDEELLEKLIAVRGLGRWSVEMFAFFALKRLDIFSTGDLGVQRGVAAYMGKDVNKLKSKGGGDKWKYMKEAEMLEIANRFVPYRSLFMWYMWRIEDVNLAVLTD